ncbi:hypothetical protein OG535_34415 [Kitasatospora sp. NBC_00085]|uniref:hypothetical protein n=1 Tax=unclassified Kitasatospora TaxID=2633591 RepID=UPI0032432FC7
MPCDTSRHRGIGRRILDGRQVAVLADATTGDLAGALALLEDTEPGDAWEDAVTAVLSALCRPGDHDAADQAIDHCLALDAEEGLAAFTTRLTLTALDATDPDTPSAKNLLRQLTSRTSESGDGYALRDLLAHEGVRTRLEPDRISPLERALAACALDSGTLPETLRCRLEEALDHARRVVEIAPFDPGSPGGNPLERRNRTAPSSVATPHSEPSNSTS